MEQVIDGIVETINKKFGGTIVTKGKRFTYSDMNKTYNDNKIVSISMEEYVNEVICTFNRIINYVKSSNTSSQETF